MPARAHHRAFPPEDAALFSGDPLARLRAAAADACWLLDRGYARDSVLPLVGDHFRLVARQREALRRGLCAADTAHARRLRALAPAAVAGATLHIDGFNLLIPLEIHLAGGVVLLCRDGTLRDLAGLRGSYHLVAETDAALDWVGTALGALQAARVRWWLDAPVANSGRLRACILAAAAQWPCATEVELVPDADRALAGLDAVVSSDSVVLDRCQSWVNLAAWLVTGAPGPVAAGGAAWPRDPSTQLGLSRMPPVSL